MTRSQSKSNEPVKSLQELIVESDDSTLVMLAFALPETAAHLLEALPVSRSNRLAKAIPKELLEQAMIELQRTPSRSSLDIEARIRIFLQAYALERDQQPEDMTATRDPLCLKALDFAGRLFGEWKMNRLPQAPGRPVSPG